MPLGSGIHGLGTPLGRHAAFKHGYRDFTFSFKVLDRVHLHPRGGNLHQQLLKLEAKWIYDMKATQYPGINGHISFQPVL